MLTRDVETGVGGTETMTRIQTATIAIVVAAMVVTAVGAGAAQNAGEITLRAAIERQTMAGDVRGAMAVYRALVNDPDRTVAAQALLHLAAAYEVIGDNREARAEYTRLVERFTDHPVAAEARARLAQMAAAGQPASQRAVWTGPYVDMFGQVSPDGRYVTFVDWARTMNLMVQDLQTGAERSLTGLSPVTTPGWKWEGEAQYSSISKDGTQVAYGWLAPPGGSAELRVLPLTASGQTTPRTLISGLSDIRYIGANDWSPDGTLVAASFQRADGTRQLALVSVTDGSVRVLKSFGWRGPSRAFFSPDGRLIAYDLPANDDTDQRDVFVMSVNATGERRVVAHEAEDALVGWSPDGTRLLFTSERTGTTSLWAQPFANGQPAGAATLVQTGVDGMSLGVTTSGGVMMFRGIDAREIRRVTLDAAAMRLSGPPATFETGSVGGASLPDWSWDGAYLASQFNPGSSERAAIAIHTVATGESRRIRGLYARQPRWSPDGRSLVTAARDTRGRDGIYRVDVGSGNATLVIAGTGIGAFPKWSPDGTKIYYLRQAAPARVVERELVSGAERDVYSAAGLVAFEVSPDGRTIAVRVRRPQADPNVMVVPVAGGEAREVLGPTRGPSGVQAGSMAWMPDGRAVLVTKREGDAPTELWYVPVAGGSPYKVQIAESEWSRDFAPDGRFSLSPDGRTIAYVSGALAAEVWAIENVVPAAR
jgi:Tol biopolymer transport system component